MITDVGDIVVHAGTEIPQAGQWLTSLVFHLFTGRHRQMRVEHLVLHSFTEIDHGRRL